VDLDVGNILESFPREAPVFPLAEVVLFPGAVLPLHIFEPRYRQMVQDALQGDRLISSGLLKQCSPEEYENDPPFHETVCIGSIVHHESLPDGRSNIALLGLSAARARAVDSPKPYRIARLEPLADQHLDVTARHFQRLEQAYGQHVSGGFSLDGLRDQLRQFWAEDRLPAALANTCALTAPLFPRNKLELLEERSLARRVDRLIELLEQPWQWN